MPNAVTPGMPLRIGLLPTTELPPTRDGLENLALLILIRTRVGGWAADQSTIRHLLTQLRALQ